MQDNVKNIDPGWFLGAKGPVAERLGGYEVRNEQIGMARAITDAFKKEEHLVVEAGTGIGKSFAYLAAALAQTVKDQRKQKIVVSTYTISLQEQLINKDIPFIKSVAGIDFNAVLVKGRGNYLCWRRLEQSLRRGASLFDSSGDVDALDEIEQWSRDTQEGSLSDLGFVPPRAVWESVCSDHSACAGRHCKRQGSCFYQLARRKMFGADLLVVNHALFFSELAVRQQGGRILPDFKFVILDEAHNTDSVASRHFGLRLSNYQVSFLLNRLYNPKTDKGLLVGNMANQTGELIDKVHSASDAFFDEVLSFNESQEKSGGNGRVRSASAFANVLSGPLKQLGNHLKNIAKEIEDPKQQQQQLEIVSYSKRCLEFAGAVHDFVGQGIDDYVFWVEGHKRRHGHFAAICGAPLDIGPILNKVLFGPVASVVLTSATLSVKGKKGKTSDVSEFEFFTSALGLKDYRGLRLGSPFDYQKQVRVIIEANLPDRRGREDEFLDAATELVRKYLLLTNGKAFILFTNFNHLRKMAKRLEDFCKDNKLKLLEQGGGVDRSVLLSEFKEDTDSVLLGTDSFWQGVDVPGRSLSNVIIFKLPFSVPDHPLLQARLERIKALGGSPFFEHQVPEAVLKFKQGFGRLIRSKTDKGIVVVLDPRIVTKNYGKAFINALPDCPIEVVKAGK